MVLSAILGFSRTALALLIASSRKQQSSAADGSDGERHAEQLPATQGLVVCKIPHPSNNRVEVSVRIAVQLGEKWEDIKWEVSPLFLRCDHFALYDGNHRLRGPDCIPPNVFDMFPREFIVSAISNGDWTW